MRITTPTTNLEVLVLKDGLIVHATDIMGWSDPITMQCKPGYKGQDLIDEWGVDDWEDFIRDWYDMEEESKDGLE